MPCLPGRSKQQIGSINSKVKVAKAGGPDEILRWLLKGAASALSQPISHLWNSSLDDGVLPQVWKSADVITPLGKTARSVDVDSDLRPILLIPTIAKGLEVLVRNWYWRRILINTNLDH